MINKKQAKYRGTLLYNTLISAVAAVAAECFLVFNTSFAEALLHKLGFEGNIAAASSGYTLLFTLIYVITGILIFTAVFALLQHRTIQYTRKISATLKKISQGSLESRISVEGDNELSDIAMQVNNMASEIQLLIDKEKKAEQTKNDLITNIAHDLRTPLTSILGYLDLLCSRKDLDEQTRQNYIKIALDKSKHLQHMIEDLFGYAKLSYGEAAATMSRLDIIRLLEQLLDEFYPVFESSGMQYEFHSDADSFIMEADGTLIARLFENLINNGIKYGAEGKLLIVNVHADDNEAVIDVINYGRIIKQEELDKIFEKFYRTESSRNSSTGGTGLGLAIAANIAKMHGGDITVRSSMEGTVFEVSLPRYRKEQEQVGDDEKE